MTATDPLLDLPSAGQSYDMAAERAVLGACLVRRDAIYEAAETGIQGRDFYVPAHEVIWDAVRSMADSSQPIEPMTVADELTKRGELARVGGFNFLNDVMRSVLTAANVSYYAHIVRDRAILRRLSIAGARIVQMADPSGGGSVPEIVNLAATEVAAVADTVHVARDESLSDVADRAIGALEAGEPFTPTPWTDLNEVIDGTRAGRFYAVGARPSVGKTMVALQWAVSTARHFRNEGRQVAYFTMEMSAERLYQRALSTASRVSGDRMRRQSLSPDDWQAIVRADQDLRSLPLSLIGSSGWSAQQIRAKARQLSRRSPVGLVVVDHIGLTKADRSSRKENRQSELSDAADVMLATAHELGASVLVLTQLNRALAGRSDQRPVPTDIRDTDRIEQNADVLLLLHRDKDAHPEDLWVAVAKNREGDEQTVKLRFDGKRSTVEDAVWSPSGAVGGR